MLFFVILFGISLCTIFRLKHHFSCRRFWFMGIYENLILKYSELNVNLMLKYRELNVNLMLKYRELNVNLILKYSELNVNLTLKYRELSVIIQKCIMYKRWADFF